MNSELTIARDILNQPLEIGDVITYPVRRGSYMNMHFGKIYSLEWIEPEQTYSNYIRPGYWNCKIIISDKTKKYRCFFVYLPK